MTKTAHTPTPWRIEDDTIKAGKNDTHLFDIYECPGLGVAAEANAAFIVRAVNSHDTLVEALETLVEVCPCQNGCAPDDMTCATQKALAALKLAKGA